MLQKIKNKILGGRGGVKRKVGIPPKSKTNLTVASTPKMIPAERCYKIIEPKYSINKSILQHYYHRI